jgi:predicted transcriptional regulator
MKSHAYLIKQINSKLDTLSREMEPLEAKLSPLRAERSKLIGARNHLSSASDTPMTLRAPTMRQAVLEYVAAHPGQRATDIAFALGRASSAVHIDLKTLVARGVAEKSEDKRYSLTASAQGV